MPPSGTDADDWASDDEAAGNGGGEQFDDDPEEGDGGTPPIGLTARWQGDEIVVFWLWPPDARAMRLSLSTDGPPNAAAAPPAGAQPVHLGDPRSGYLLEGFFRLRSPNPAHNRFWLSVWARESGRLLETVVLDRVPPPALWAMDVAARGADGTRAITIEIVARTMRSMPELRVVHRVDRPPRSPDDGSEIASFDPSELRNGEARLSARVACSPGWVRLFPPRDEAASGLRLYPRPGRDRVP